MFFFLNIFQDIRARLTLNILSDSLYHQLQDLVYIKISQISCLYQHTTNKGLIRSTRGWIGVDQSRVYNVGDHPKISTFWWVYKQYTFSDPTPPQTLPLKCTYQHFRFQNKRLMQQHIYCTTTKINQSSERAMW